MTCPVAGKTVRDSGVVCTSCIRQGVPCPVSAAPIKQSSVSALKNTPVVVERKKKVSRPKRESATAQKANLAGKYQGEDIRLILPIKLPTWNRLLALNPWQRKRVRDWLHEHIYECIQNGNVQRTSTTLVLRPCWTESSVQEYYQMIAQSTSRKSATVKKRPRQMKR